MLILIFTLLELTRSMAVDIALKNNLTLRAEKIEVEAKRVGIDQSYASIYPQVNLSAGYSYLSPIPVMKFQLVPNQPEVEIPMGRSRNYSLGASLTQPLFTWGNLYRLVKISKLGYHIQKTSFLRKRQELIRNVKNGFDNCLLAREFLNLLRQSHDRLSRYHRIIKTRYEAGLVPRYDLLRTEAELAQNEASIIEAENNLRLALDGLKMLLNIEDEIRPVGEIEYRKLDITLDSALTFALKHRPEMKGLLLSYRMAEIGFRSSIFNLLPAAFGMVNYEYKRPYQFTEEKWGGSWVFSVGISWPIFSGFKKKTDIAKARMELKKARLGCEFLKEAIRFEAKSAYLKLKKAEAMIEAQEKVLKQADKTRKMIEERYQNGLAKSIELLDGELVYSRAKIGFLKARIEYDQAFNDLMLALGKEER